MASHTATIEAANRRFAEIFADINRIKATTQTVETTTTTSTQSQPAEVLPVSVEIKNPARGAGLLERDPRMLRRFLVRTA